MRLDGKIAAVTGGANGIGRAAAEKLRDLGAEVWVLDLEREQPESTAASFGCRGAVVDVTDRSSVERALSLPARLDLLVANAGTVYVHDLGAATEEQWRRTLDVNLTGAFHSVQTAAARMQAQRSGAIVLTASTNSFDGEAGLIAYNATKAGVLGILHTAANELGPYGVRINAVCPGLIRTRLTAGHFANDAVIRDYFRHIPLGRGGEPEEVAGAIAFLLSGEASYITGATLLVDGGQMAGKFGTWNEERAEFKDGRWRLR